jgi:hypothetical protein
MKEIIGYTLLVIAIYIIGFMNGATSANNKIAKIYSSFNDSIKNRRN